MKWLSTVLASLALLSVASAAPPHAFSPSENETPHNLAKKSLLSGLCRSIEIRREWRTFSSKEKKAYLDAVKCLTKKPHSNKLVAQYPRPNMVPINPNGSFYDDMTFVHMDQTDHIHYTGLFLPWHRWYVSQHVKQLKEQCGYKGVMPYWDWSLDADNIPGSPLFDGSETSFGSVTGNANNDYYLSNGGLKDMIVNYPITRNIRRRWTPYPYLEWWWVPRPQEIATLALKKERILSAILNYKGNFIGFQNATEQAQSFHPNVHMMMGGDMAGTCPQAAGSGCQGGSTWTPSDPLFFLHHANLDRIWFLWQLVHPDNFWAFAGGSVSTYTDPAYPNGYPPWLSLDDKLPTDGLFESYKIRDVLNPVTTPAGCYIYL